jgi:hypothetical protein
VLTKDEARQIAVNVTRLPELLGSGTAMAEPIPRNPTNPASHVRSWRKETFECRTGGPVLRRVSDDGPPKTVPRALGPSSESLQRKKPR